MKICLIIIPIIIVAYLFSHTLTLRCAHQALVTVPVADLISRPIQQSFPNLSIQQAYDQLPLSGGNTNPYHSCLRMHQLLLHETVTIVQQQGDEVCVEIPHLFYITHTNKTPQHTYWMLKKNLTPLRELKKRSIDLKKIPAMPSFEKKTVEDKYAIILAMPYKDPVTQQTFSAGTRFVMVPNTAQTKTEVTVYAFDARINDFTHIQLPLDLVIKPAGTKKEKMKQFVNLMRRWTSINNGFFPYVWGGTSLVDTSNGNYLETQMTINGQDCSYYNLSDIQKSPKTGMDCSGLIARAAQMCGIPYFFKNTLTTAQNMATLQKNQTLQEGDIIWISGHVMVVSDLKKNRLFEARSSVYGGQGKLQEISLDKVFHGMTTYDKLIEAYHQKEPLNRLDKDGNIVQKCYDFKLLKLETVFR